MLKYLLIGTLGLGMGSVGGASYVSGVKDHQPVYGSKEADALAAKADKDKDGVLESKELADLLKDLGYAGAPVPAHAVPFFQVGGTKDLEVSMNYAMNGPSLSVRVPKEAAEKYLGR